MSDVAAGPGPAFEYLLTGRNPRGRTVTLIVEAESADEAVRRFAGRGYSDVVLHTDDNMARFLKPSKTLNMFTPCEYLGYRTRGRLGCMAFLARKLYVKTWYVHALCLALLGLHWWAGGLGWDFFDVFPALVLAFPVLFAAYAELTSQAVAHKRVLRAVAWARWEQIPRLLKRVRRLELPSFERPLREAQALAGLGRLGEGLDHFAPVGDDPNVPPHMYWAFRAAILAAARERDKALAAVARAAELAPENPVVLIEYAISVLAVKRDTRRARDLLDRAARHALSDMAMPNRLFAEGVIAYEEGNAAGAVAKLDEAIRSMRPYARANPLVEVNLARMRAYLAMAHAALGDREAARRAAARAEPILARHHAMELVRCREIVG